MRKFLKPTLLALLFFGAIFALYLPFSGNPVVFDDYNIIANNSAYDAAQTIFSRYARTFPYFTIGFVHVISGSDLAWNRVLSAVLHGLVVITLYCLLRRAFSRFAASEKTQSGAALIVCLWVALNPVAVYAAGYLIQRSIVLATLFGLVSLNLYLRAQAKGRTVDLVSAALLAGLAMMSKEHAVLLPLAALALTPLVCAWDRATLRRALIFFLLALPVCVWVIVHRGRDVVGQNYEIYAGQILAQTVMPQGFEFASGVWLMSIATQLLLFWKYLFLWLLPDPRWMSADLRVDFQALWAGVGGFAAAALALAVLIGAVFVGWRSKTRSSPGLFASLSAAVLFAAILFAPEFSAVRVQEPFVLYRSYLWMPAYALLLGFLLMGGDGWLARRGSAFPRYVFWACLVLGCAALFPLAQNRLQSFSSENALWQDALEKLPRADIPGADRIYYNLAGESFKRKDFTEALRLSERVVKQNPTAFQGYLARGTAQLALDELDAAQRDFNAADQHRPPKEFTGYIEYKRCLIIQRRNLPDEFISCLQRSAKMGYGGAKFQLKMAGIPEEK